MPVPMKNFIGADKIFAFLEFKQKIAFSKVM